MGAETPSDERYPGMTALRGKGVLAIWNGIAPGQDAEFIRSFWMSVNAESRHRARMEAIWTYLGDTVAAQRDLLLPGPMHPRSTDTKSFKIGPTL